MSRCDGARPRVRARHVAPASLAARGRSGRAAAAFDIPGLRGTRGGPGVSSPPRADASRFAASGLEAALARLASLSEEEILRQEALVSARLASGAAAGAGVPARRPRTPPASRAGSRRPSSRPRRPGRRGRCGAAGGRHFSWRLRRRRSRGRGRPRAARGLCRGVRDGGRGRRRRLRARGARLDHRRWRAWKGRAAPRRTSRARRSSARDPRRQGGLPARLSALLALSAADGSNAWRTRALVLQRRASPRRPARSGRRGPRGLGAAGRSPHDGIRARRLRRRRRARGPRRGHRPHGLPLRFRGRRLRVRAHALRSGVRETGGPARAAARTPASISPGATVLRASRSRGSPFSTQSTRGSPTTWRAHSTRRAGRPRHEQQSSAASGACRGTLRRRGRDRPARARRRPRARAWRSRRAPPGAAAPRSCTDRDARAPQVLRGLAGVGWAFLHAAGAIPAPPAVLAFASARRVPACDPCP